MIIPLKGGEEVKNDERGERGLRYESQTHPQYSCDVCTAQQKQVCGSAWQVSSAWLLREMGLLPGQPEPTTSPSSFHSRGVSVSPVDQEGVILTSEELTRRCLNCFELSTWGYSKNHHRH